MSAIPPIGAGLPPAGPTAAPAAASRARAGNASAPAAGLWDVLTDEERAYFQSVAALGPVSYGPAGVPSAPATAPVGQRIDVTG